MSLGVPRRSPGSQTMAPMSNTRTNAVTATTIMICAGRLSRSPRRHRSQLISEDVQPFITYAWR
jgi:hypothetical protein